MDRKSRRPAKPDTMRDGVHTAIFDMEPELRRLHGLLILLTVLSEATEPIEPEALALLTQAGHSIHEGLARQWSTCMSVLKNA